MTFFTINLRTEIIVLAQFVFKMGLEGQVFSRLIMRKIIFLKLSIFLDILYHGYFSILLSHFRQRMFSQKKFYLLKKDLYVNKLIDDAKFEFTLRKLKKNDFNELFDSHIIYLNAIEFQEFRKRKMLNNYNFRECYVTVDENDRPVLIQWLMYPDENEKINKLYANGIKKLDVNEVLFTGIYTHPDFRCKGIMTGSLLRISEILKQNGERFALAYVECDNIPSIKALQKAGFDISETKIDIWRFFKKKSVFLEDQANSEANHTKIN